VHVDGSARVQSVTREQNERYYDLIKNFAVRTGVPAVLNTSFNLKGEPIVNSPFNAIRTFYTSGLDALILDRCLIEKTLSPNIEQQYGEGKKDDSRLESQSSNEGALW
jgi:carbamoyltransferase